MSLTDTLNLSRGFVGLWMEWRIRVLVAHSNQWVCGSVCQCISESVGFFLPEWVSYLLSTRGANATSSLCQKVVTRSHVDTDLCSWSKTNHTCGHLYPCPSHNINKRPFFFMGLVGSLGSQLAKCIFTVTPLFTLFFNFFFFTLFYIIPFIHILLVQPICHIKTLRTLFLPITDT